MWHARFRGWFDPRMKCTNLRQSLSRYLIMSRVTKRFLNTPCNVGDLLNGTCILMFKLVCQFKLYLPAVVTFMIKCYCQQSNCYHHPLIFYFCCQGCLALWLLTQLPYRIHIMIHDISSLGSVAAASRGNIRLPPGVEIPQYQD